MSPLSWFQRLFASPADDPEAGGDPIVAGQHIRVVLAILVCIISAFVIWWILS